MDDNLSLVRVMALAVTIIAVTLTSEFSAQAKEKPARFSPESAKIAVSLKKLGWAANPTESNRRFFRNFSMAKLLAVDIGSKVAFINNDIVAVSHTKETSSQPKAHRTFEVFFISARDGSLLRSLRWDTKARGSYLELEDSRNRLIPLQDGTFVVVVDTEMLLYGSSFRLLKEFHFDSTSLNDMWAVQSVDSGRKIFLRHESARDGQVTYSWLDAGSLQILKHRPAPGDFDSGTGIVAGKDFLLAKTASGIQLVGPNTHKLFRDNETEKSFLYQLIGPAAIVVSGKSGISLIDIDHGPVWAKIVSKPDKFQFGDIHPAMMGEKFGVWVQGDSHELFDGVRVTDSPLFVIFDTNGNRYPFAIPIKPVNEQWNVALSADGEEVAVFDGANLKVYQLDWSDAGSAMGH